MTLAASGIFALADAPAPAEGEPAPGAGTLAALEAEWPNIREDVIRQQAQVPSSADSVPLPLPPRVTSLPGSSTVVVEIPVLGGEAAIHARYNDLDYAAEVLADASAASSNLNYKVKRVSNGHIVIGARPYGSQARGLQVEIPSLHGRASSVTVRKEGGFTKEELVALLDLVRAANDLVPADLSRSPRLGGTQQGWPALEEELGFMGQRVEALLRDFLGEGLAREMEVLRKDLMRGVEQSVAQTQEGEQGSEWQDARQLKRPPALPAVQQEDDPWPTQEARSAAKQLEGMGCLVYPPGNKEQIDWGLLAGYDEQKQALEDCLLLPLQHPDIFDSVARGTRASFQSNRPRALLLAGPPGTGKTTSARVISTQAALPLVYLPLEAVVSKWYGEAEQKLAAVFKAAEALGGCILFLDELDSLATSRDNEINEASRRLLSVLLREIEGFQGAPRCVIIGATNRRQDLDPALLSRFDTTVTFPLPDTPSRVLILKQYAKQLSDDELRELAVETNGMSGRDLRDVCEGTERRWASKIIRGSVEKGQLPSVAEYLSSARARAMESNPRLRFPYAGPLMIDDALPST